MGFFGSLFGKKETPVRQLKHPSELQKGDMISLDDSFCPARASARAAA